VRSEEFYVNEKSTDTSWNRTSGLRFVAQHLNHCATTVPGYTIYAAVVTFLGKGRDSGTGNIFGTQNI